jgi:hypothetical protein
VDHRAISTDILEFRGRVLVMQALGGGGRLRAPLISDTVPSVYSDDRATRVFWAAPRVSVAHPRADSRWTSRESGHVPRVAHPAAHCGIDSCTSRTGESRAGAMR